MQPVIALVGRPNVGKSTLFNRFTRSRDALVANLPGLTRDRQYGLARLDERSCLVIDTGGLTGEDHVLDEAMARQTLLAVDEADLILLLVDGRAGLTAADQQIAQQLRQLGKSLLLVVNKTDGIDAQEACAEFHALGLGEPQPVAASHGRGMRQLTAEVLARLPAEEVVDEGAADASGEGGIKVAVVGRPNVGKSTLINRILGEERLVAFDQPGTTRDSVAVPFERDGQRYTLIDTAGLRRRGKVVETVEKFSVIKTLQAIDQANVVILVLDAHQGVAEQDAGLLGLVLDSGRAIVVAVNKWDGLSDGQGDEIRRVFDFRLGFLDFADIHFISARHGSGVGKLFGSVNKAYASAIIDCKASHLTRILQQAVQQHPPPIVRRRRIKLRYAHQGGRNPPIVVIHGNQVDSVPGTYRRYLSNTYRKALKLTGTPVRVEFRAGENPYEGKKNPLSPRQQARRKRMIRHVKKR
ncbi:MAG: ribosome biogenesis GTPase Der [Gammaproteobacteria bacterium]|nr:MAG: ribosome biogenesis GTPase Der [Gammaproteobacteria bacterium]